MRLTKDIQVAIKKAIVSHGTQAKFAAMTRVKQQNISKYLNSRVEFINPDSWEKIYPFIMEYLSNDFNEPFIREIAISSAGAIGFPFSRHLKDQNLGDRILPRIEFSIHIGEKIINAILDDETLDGNARLHLRKKINELVYDYENELIKKYDDQNQKTEERK